MDGDFKQWYSLWEILPLSLFPNIVNVCRHFCLNRWVTTDIQLIIFTDIAKYPSLYIVTSGNRKIPAHFSIILTQESMLGFITIIAALLRFMQEVFCDCADSLCDILVQQGLTSQTPPEIQQQQQQQKEVPNLGQIIFSSMRRYNWNIWGKC